jgi:integrase/recombinase XerD
MWLSEKSESTRSEYERDLKVFLGWLSVPIEEVGLEVLQDYRDFLLGKYAAQTVKRKLATVKSLFSFGADIGAFDLDPTRPLGLPSGTGVGADRILSKSEVEAIIGAAVPGRDRALVRFLYRTGVRASEAAGLTTGDVTVQGEGPILQVTGKGDKTRSVRLPEEVFEEVMEVSDGHALFPSGNGPLSRTSIWRVVKQAATKAGVKTEGGTSEVSPHWLRHAHASHALQNGASIELVRDTLGHESIETTQQYLHAVPSESSTDYL